MSYTPEYITELFESDDISSPALIRMIEISGLNDTKIAEENNITLDYLGKIKRGERKANDMRRQLKQYLYEVSLISNRRAA